MGTGSGGCGAPCSWQEVVHGAGQHWGWLRSALLVFDPAGASLSQGCKALDRITKMQYCHRMALVWTMSVALLVWAGTRLTQGWLEVR